MKVPSTSKTERGKDWILTETRTKRSNALPYKNTYIVVSRVNGSDFSPWRGHLIAQCDSG